MCVALSLCAALGLLALPATQPRTPTVLCSCRFKAGADIDEKEIHPEDVNFKLAFAIQRGTLALQTEDLQPLADALLTNLHFDFTLKVRPCLSVRLLALSLSLSLSLFVCVCVCLSVR